MIGCLGRSVYVIKSEWITVGQYSWSFSWWFLDMHMQSCKIQVASQPRFNKAVLCLPVKICPFCRKYSATFFAFLSFLFMCLEVFLRKWWMHFHKSKNRWERILRQETDPSLAFATLGWKELLAISQWEYTFWFYKVRSWLFSQTAVFRTFPNSNSDDDDSNSNCCLVLC